jgi:hypothetical protein
LCQNVSIVRHDLEALLRFYASETSQDCNTQFQAQLCFEQLVIATSASFAKRTLTKGGEYDYHSFGCNQLHSGRTVTTSLCIVYVSYGEQHCITTPIILSIGNNVIPSQLVQMTIKAMLVHNLNLSMLLSQHADTMIPMYEIMQTSVVWGIPNSYLIRYIINTYLKRHRLGVD